MAGYYAFGAFFLLLYNQFAPLYLLAFLHFVIDGCLQSTDTACVDFITWSYLKCAGWYLTASDVRICAGNAFSDGKVTILRVKY